MTHDRCHVVYVRKKSARRLEQLLVSITFLSPTQQVGQLIDVPLMLISTLLPSEVHECIFDFSGNNLESDITGDDPAGSLQSVASLIFTVVNESPDL